MILTRDFKVAAYAGRRIILVAPCERSAARGNDIPPAQSTPKRVELLTEFCGVRAASKTPRCASLARGYQYVRPTVFLK